MGHLTYESSKAIATKTILILAAITIFEVLFALLGKGYLVEGFHISGWITGAMMIFLSIVKAYLIVYEFMHMKYEVPGLVRTVLLPTLLLVWAIIAFLVEGKYWLNSRDRVKNKEEQVAPEAPKQEGHLYVPDNTML